MDDRSTNELARYLCVDRFLQNLVGATSLKTAFDLRVIDRLVGSDGVDHSALYESFEFDRQGFDMLLNLLTVNQVIESSGERIRLTEPFAHALQFGRSVYLVNRQPSTIHGAISSLSSIRLPAMPQVDSRKLRSDEALDAFHVDAHTIRIGIRHVPLRLQPTSANA